MRQPKSGRVLIDGSDVTGKTPAARGIGYVPQDGALFKTMTVGEQFALPLVIRHETSLAIEKRVGELASLLEIAHLLDRKPQGLSGGERQRVALGRALSFSPAILLLDEPLAALDDTTRANLIRLLKDVHARTGATVLHVTHNRSEAEALGIALLCLKDGTIQKLAPEANEDR